MPHSAASSSPPPAPRSKPKVGSESTFARASRKSTLTPLLSEALGDEVEGGADGGEADTVAIAGKNMALDEGGRAGPGGRDIAGADRILFISAAGARVAGHSNRNPR